MRVQRLLQVLTVAMVTLITSITVVSAETQEVRLSKQPGLPSLPLLIMEDQKLYEKHLAAAGLFETKVSWQRVLGGAILNDLLISGRIEFVLGSATTLAPLWAATKGTRNEIKGVVGCGLVPIYLNTRNANLKSIRDLTATDKIQVPAVKVSIQSVILQIIASKEKDWEYSNKIDQFTVSVPPADALIALTSGMGEITSAMQTPPFATEALKSPKVHSVFKSYDVFGGPQSLSIIYASAKFRDENPKTFQAFRAAFDEAVKFIAANKRAAAETYLKLSPEKVSVDELTALLGNPDIQYSATPQRTMPLVEHLFKAGTIKSMPASWKDMWFPEVHELQGS